MLSAWLRVIRVRFLLASVVAVSTGLAVAWRYQQEVDPLDAVLTFAGVLALHASVDMLNDFWDYKRGIDTSTRRTKMSGGTGVLPEGLLEPSAVYRAGVISLIIGASIGVYFALTGGIVIAIILTFAILSVYFYSTRIVDSGLGETFVAIKGALIVIAACLIQTGEIIAGSIPAGIVIGVLSALVLFVASFPDHDADKSKGRKTLVIMTGKRLASRLFWVFPTFACLALIAGVILGLLPYLSLFTLLAAPLAVRTGLNLQKNYDSEDMLPCMSGALLYGRITGVLLAGTILLDSLL
ncbi:MAG: prenyltransferase [Nitrosopumilus sp. D6]|nr:MAG: prenyltransferase [Nitrosopumilus sp. D6]